MKILILINFDEKIGSKLPSVIGTLDLTKIININ